MPPPFPVVDPGMELEGIPPEPPGVNWPIPPDSWVFPWLSQPS